MSQLHRSSISQYSRSVLVNESDELTDEELAKQVNDLKEQIRILKLENEIIEKTILRVDPALMVGVQQALDYAYRLHSATSLHPASMFLRSQSRFGLESLASPSRLISSPSRISTRRIESTTRMSINLGTPSGGSRRVNVLERSELVAQEMGLIVTHMEKTRMRAAKQHSLLKAQLEEITVRVDYVNQSSEIFRQVVIIEGLDKIAQRIPAEIWIRNMTEWVKVTDSHIGKLRLRTSTLNTQFSKLKSQIKFKAELSESLRPVDFEKLKIQNDECLKIIDRKLAQLVELKAMTGDANLNLTIHKNLMMDQNNYLSNVQKAIKKKQQQTIALDKERVVISEQVEKLQVKLDGVKTVRLAYEVPDIMDYVQVKAELYDIKHGMNILINRNHIQQIALNSLNRKIKSLSIII